MGEEQKNLPISSSNPPEFPPEQEALFREVLQLLNEKQVPYAVSGAFAMQQHTGIWRQTKDLDLFLTEDEAKRASELLQAHGFKIEVVDAIWLTKCWRDGFFVDLITGMSNGIIVVEKSWIEGSSRAKILGVPTRVLAAEELLASKMFVMFRERFDGADIAHIIHGTRGRLDWDRLMELVGNHWELLFCCLLFFHYVYPAKIEFIPKGVWYSLLDKTREAVTHPDPKAPFRGSLLDQRMFAIDVQEWGMKDLFEETRRQRQRDLAEGAPAVADLASPALMKPNPADPDEEAPPAERDLVA